MPFPVAPVVMPADLAGQSNGNLPAGLLTDVGPSGKLHHLAGRAFLALVSAAWDQGLPLTYTYGGTYRPYVAQETLFRSRYAIGGTGGGCKSWDSDGNGLKESWCKKSSNLATAAVPGTSNHGWGLAVDTAFDTNPTDGVGPDDAAGITGHAQWPWLLANAERFGFSWELQSEPWHIRYVAGDAVPQAVLDFEAPPTIPPPTTTDEVDMILIKYDRGGGNWTGLSYTGAHLAHITTSDAWSIPTSVGAPVVDVNDTQLDALIRSAETTTTCPPEWVGTPRGAVWTAQRG